MDNRRTIIIFLVVLYHVGGVYESAGLWGWFWIVDDPATMTWVGVVGIMFDLFVMPTMFFIAGYLTPPSLDKKTGWGFVKGKIKRLLLPWVIAVFTLLPIYKFIFLYSRGLPQENWTSSFELPFVLGDEPLAPELLAKELRKSDAGKNVSAIGYEHDILTAARIDHFQSVPELDPRTFRIRLP